MLRDARFASGIFSNGIAHMSMLASSFLIPFLLERGRGLQPADTGQLVLVMQVTMVSLLDAARLPVRSVPDAALRLGDARRRSASA